MLNFGLFAIKTSDSERGSSVKELFTSFEDCIKNRMKYADWWMDYGHVSIVYYPANCKFSYAMYWDIKTNETGDWEITHFFNHSEYDQTFTPINPLDIGITDERYYTEMKKFIEKNN